MTGVTSGLIASRETFVDRSIKEPDIAPYKLAAIIIELCTAARLFSDNKSINPLG
jgi:hypothetical protein